MAEEVISLEMLSAMVVMEASNVKALLVETAEDDDSCLGYMLRKKR